MLFAHPEHGFHHAPAGEAEALKASGWEPCADPMEYKARVWGIGKPNPEKCAYLPEAESQAPEPSDPGDDGVAPIQEDGAPAKRRGRPRKAE